MDPEVIFVFFFGLILGSFFNVCIYRIPKGQSVVTPRSRCPACGMLIAWYDNIPILSYLLLRGKCRHCKARIPLRYPLVELLTALVFAGIWLTNPAGLSLAYFTLAGLLIPAIFIDFDTMELPDRFTIGGFFVGLIISAIYPELHVAPNSSLPWILNVFESLFLALLGACAGSGMILWVALIAESILKEEAMGFGDVKLLGCIGAFLGWQGALFAFFGGSLLGTLAILPLYFGKKLKKTETGKHLELAFGPWIGFAALLYIIFFQESFLTQIDLIRSIYS